jgi:beta-glucosidase/6-phospho-beta-glucosidase/beta-galactosidase
MQRDWYGHRIVGVRTLIAYILKPPQLFYLGITSTFFEWISVSEWQLSLNKQTCTWTRIILSSKGRLNFKVSTNAQKIRKFDNYLRSVKNMTFRYVLTLKHLNLNKWYRKVTTTHMYICIWVYCVCVRCPTCPMKFRESSRSRLCVKDYTVYQNIKSVP